MSLSLYDAVKITPRRRDDAQKQHSIFEGMCGYLAKDRGNGLWEIKLTEPLTTNSDVVFELVLEEEADLTPLYIAETEGKE